MKNYFKCTESKHGSDSTSKGVTTFPVINVWFHKQHLCTTVYFQDKGCSLETRAAYNLLESRRSKAFDAKMWFICLLCFNYCTETVYFMLSHPVCPFLDLKLHILLKCQRTVINPCVDTVNHFGKCSMMALTACEHRVRWGQGLSQKGPIGYSVKGPLFVLLPHFDVVNSSWSQTCSLKFPSVQRLTVSTLSLSRESPASIKMKCVWGACVHLKAIFHVTLTCGSVKSICVNRHFSLSTSFNL